MRRDRVYFTVMSKEGVATLSIEHPRASQSLTLPVHPSEAVSDVLPHLTPPAAHYAAQWRKVMVSDPDEREAEAFSVPESELPDGIAPTSSQAEIWAVVDPHVPGVVKQAWEIDAAKTFRFGEVNLNSNVDEFCVDVESHPDIERWTGAP